jgi:hypothetical protein
MGEAKRKQIDGWTAEQEYPKWLYLAAFYDQVATDHLKAGHILGRAEFLKSGCMIMVPTEVAAELAAMGCPFTFVRERLPTLKQEMSRNGLHITRR